MLSFDELFECLVLLFDELFEPYYSPPMFLFRPNQRKLGSNTSELRTNRILRLEMMKGGTSSNNT